MTFVLHGYFRSTASYRVRIALNLKSLAYTDLFHHLRRGEQRAPEYLALNPQGLVPTLITDAGVLHQSLAICEYLEEIVPDPALLPSSAIERAKVRAAAQIIACDIHPVQNLKILDRLRALGANDEQVTEWARVTITEGLDAFDKALPDDGSRFCFGNSPTLADVCLIPQLVNARRFGVEMQWQRIAKAEANCRELTAFTAAAPENQPDAE